MPPDTPSRPALCSRRQRFTKLLLAVSLLLTVACSGPDSETRRFHVGGSVVEVRFNGEISDDVLFGRGGSLIDHVRPFDEQGNPRERVSNARPGWLHFAYRIDGESRELLVAKLPIMNSASWEDIARAGAALGDDSTLSVAGTPALQRAMVSDLQGHRYRVRLMRCGQSTLADLSEWNLLIGAVHRGDMDFTGERYGWIASPYDDEDLKVGYHGSLTWCQDDWRGDRVARGYFFVSRFHAAPGHLRTTRLYWRPVLERVPSGSEAPSAAAPGDGLPAIAWSPNLEVGYGGLISNDTLFGEHAGVDSQIDIVGGRYLSVEQPDWLQFHHQGRTLLVAAQPIKYGVSWDEIARAGAATGDGSWVRIGWRLYRQNAEIEDVHGRRYRVRLIGCGHSTLDHDSEWNALIGGVHRGDGDFRAHPEAPYGWLNPALDDAALGIGDGNGAATWCRERLDISGKTHAINRGFLTVSRFHATETDFDGAGFGWRPVLEELP